MHQRRLLAPVVASAIGLSLAFGTVPAMAAPTAEPTSVSYSNMVLNIGSTEADRNFVWYSSSDSADQQVRLVEKGAEGTEGAVRLLDSTDTGTSKDFPELTWNHAGVTGLKPGTTYVWEAGSEAEGWSEAYEFTTQSDDRLDVLVFGDTQIGSGGGVPTDGGAWQSTLDTALEGVANPDFLLSVGDQVNTHDSASEYTDYLTPDGVRGHALATNIGNHDDGSAADAQHSYAEHFNMPNRTANPGWNNEMGNYWYIQDNTLFVSLNSNHRVAADHEEYVRAVVAEHGQDVQWKVATWHHSLYSTASHATDGDIEDRREWMPSLMTELDFDVVLSGHDHVYNRSNLLYNGHPVNNPVTEATPQAPSELAKYEGEVLYMTMQSSTGSKYYGIQDGIEFPFNAVQSQLRTPAYAHLEVDGDTLSITEHQVGGEVLDEVSMTKNGTANPVAPPEGIGQTKFSGPGVVDTPIENVVNEETGEVTVEARTLSPFDDVEESVGDGAMDIGSSDIEIVQESPGDEDPDDQFAGLRFDQVGIPAGATVTGAYLQFTTDEHDKTGDPFDVQIHVEDTGAAAKYTDENFAVSSRSYLEQTVAWKDAPLWTENGEQGEAQRTPDLTALVQAAVDQDDWARGGALNFMLSGTGTRTAEAYEGGGSEQAPKLMVTYVLEDGVTEVKGEIVENRDDVEQYVDGDDAGKMDHGSTDLEIVDEKTDQKQAVGLRYADLQIPAGSEILSARVQFTTDEADKNVDPFNVAIAAEATDDSAAFSDEAGNLTSRTLTGAAAEWSGIPAWDIEHESGTAQRTADLSPVLQEVVDREGWAAGNALSLLLTGEGQRSAESRDGEEEMAPELWVTYRKAGAEPTEPTDPTDPTDPEIPEVPEVPEDFSDNVPGTVYYAPVRWLQLEGITTGYTDGTFRKGEEISRGESVAFLHRYLKPENAATQEDLSDVHEDSNFFEAIAWADGAGVTTGYADGTFRAGQDVTRAEFVTFLYRASGEDFTAPAGSPFPDVNTASTHYEAIAWASSRGIVNGYRDGDYRPQDQITRAEVAKVLHYDDNVQTD
ncbi:S-layer homology domain-containing protein [Microbacterium sp. A93]|uniref:S-layer homology domain-containing protein n=1 Tax=Microbacterium sp. A93 TaxID=3450716 RepID=UPI003F43890B